MTKDAAVSPKPLTDEDPNGLNSLPMQLLRRFLQLHCAQVESGIPYLCGSCNVCKAMQHFEKQRERVASLEQRIAEGRWLLQQLNHEGQLTAEGRERLRAALTGTKDEKNG